MGRALTRENIESDEQLLKSIADAIVDSDEGKSESGDSSSGEQNSASSESSSDDEATAVEQHRELPSLTVPDLRAASTPTTPPRKRTAAEAFEAKLRDELRRCAEPLAKKARLHQVRKALEKRGAGIERVAGVGMDGVQSLLRRLEEECDGAASDHPAAGSGARLALPAEGMCGSSPGSSRSLSNWSPSNSWSDEDSLTPERPSSSSSRASKAAERVEVESCGAALGLPECSAADPPQRPLASALRQPFAPRKYPNALVTYSDAHRIPLVQEHLVDCHRSYGEQLWYSKPGSAVVCDVCDVEVPQVMGELLGAPGKSQFAQFEFRCRGCLNASCTLR
mmetsp:Transcript_62002/g.134424  ORF Transcript_62002/g.134424 Transcript_62002/m.134424 type:complete len:337 (-) Transcript_62002:115-1125(-)|eukprot:CAMPEP_0170604002 /NCGR_PEP_ID=MMETSP0224-20130122/19199_1 /TAXON_ID=285029 /ORGANISM="Togula jolla, Strain CCCM 725" /LENGTH=336 /DNA_ID=CAMNT_0010928893 /DNA_START=66 /DNA_END=1076 /DNA_ORIENTATION=-